MMDYTIEIYRKDRRCKSGERFVGSYDYKNVEETWMKQEIQNLRYTVMPSSKFRIELFETWVTRKNLMTGKEYKERYDTPHYCSPSRESYWSM